MTVNYEPSSAKKPAFNRPLGLVPVSEHLAFGDFGPIIRVCKSRWTIVP